MLGRKTRASLAFVRESLSDEQERNAELLDDIDILKREASFLRAEIKEIEDFVFEHPRSPLDNLVTRLKVLLEKERAMDAFDAMRNGTYDADIELLRKLACVLGTSHINTQSILSRADQLKTVQSQNRALGMENRNLRSKIDELRFEEDAPG